MSAASSFASLARKASFTWSEPLVYVKATGFRPRRTFLFGCMFSLGWVEERK